MIQKPETQKGAAWTFFTRVAPFLLPALAFELLAFAIVSPLPFFILTLRKQVRLSVLALISNTILVYTLGSPYEAAVAFFLWTMVGILFPFLIRKLGRIKQSFILGMVFSLSILCGTLYYSAHEAGQHPIEFVRSEISQGVDRMLTLPDSPIKPIIEEQGRDSLQKQILTELPSGTVIALILVFWINLLFASQMVRGFLSRSFWSNYRNPEWLVWPTLACATLFAFTDHALYYIGLNGFKILVLFYGFQGLSILSHLLNRYKILGLGRALIFSIAIFIVMPIVLSLGFFDLWFDFRKKFGQS